MFGKFIMFSVVAAGLSAGGAHASAYRTEQPASPKAATDQLLLAQGRDVDIYYDEYGRRVVIDSFRMSAPEATWSMSFGSIAIHAGASGRSGRTSV